MPMTPERAQDASNLLYDAWTGGDTLEALPGPVRPASREEGYAIQALLESRSAKPLYGWKIAATGKEGQRHINVDGPLAGRLLAERIVADGGRVPSANNRMRVAEVEFAFRMARDLPPREAPYAVDEVLDAAGTLHAAIEIPDSRYEDFTKVGAPQLIADDACAHYFVCAEATGADWRALDLVAHRAVGRVEGRYDREGSGAAVLGDPRVALAWLANELRALGIPLKAGQVVTTGTCFKPLELEPGDVVVADLGVLGRARVRFD
jgi:2-keto-4-pentenoate hydratase